jgi:hypothetical protein
MPGKSIGFYNKKDHEPSMFTKFSIKGGEVMYIGNFEVDVRKAGKIRDSLRNFHYTRKSLLRYLEKNYPSYFNDETNFSSKLKERFVQRK